MKKKTWLWLVVGLVWGVGNFALAADKVMVRATGQAPAELPNAREAAVEAALRQAVEIGAGVDVWSATETRDFQLIRDVIFLKTAGIVETYDVLQENPNQNGLYTVRVEAIVSSRADINTRLEAWKALIKRKGRPRLMVTGSVDRMPFERRLTAEVQGVLDHKGLTVIDLDMLEENKRGDAERAAKGDLDPAKAALISREVGADYLVVVQIEGTRFSAQSNYGVSLYPVDATVILKVIAADTARIIASETLSSTQRAKTSERAMMAVTSEVTASALKAAIKRIAAHWLEDVDQRGGAEFTVVANAFGFDRLQRLISGLRAAGGVKAIIVDSTDYQGRSSFRVVANNTAFNIAAVLRQVDPGIMITNSSKYRIEIALGKAPGKPLSTGLIIAISAGLAAVILVIIALAKISKRA